MPSVTAGVIAAGVGAVGSIASGAIGGSAAQSAADTQAAAANQASQNALQQYYQTRADLSPYRTIGASAADQLAAIFGLSSGSGGGSGASGTTQAATAPTATATAGSVSAGGGLPTGWTITPGQVVSGGSDNAGDRFIEAQVHDQNGNFVSFVPGGGDGTAPSTQSAAQYLAQQGIIPAQDTQSAASTTPAAASTAATGVNPLSSYGLSGLTYQTPSNIASVLSNPQFQPTQAQLEATPGYQFDLSQGLLGVANSNAAQGRGVSGAALKGSAAYATGLANNTLTTQAGIFNQNYNNALNQNAQGSNIFQSNLGNIINPLQYLTTLGQNSAATTGAQGIQAIGNANQALIGGANAQAAGTVGSANALSSGISGLGNSATNYLLYNNLLSGGGGGGGVVAGGGQGFDL